MAEQGSDENIFTTINNQYYTLTASERKVADYVCAHRREVQYMSISELADECGVADATISRFCRRLKLKGYNGFKLALAKETARESVSAAQETDRTVEAQDDIQEMCRKLYVKDTEALTQTLSRIESETLSRAVDLLTEAERVYCMGQGGSMIMSQEAAHLFSTVSPRFFCVVGSHMQAQTAALLTERDVLLFISYSGSTRDIADVMTLARDQGCRIILITRFAKSPGAALADVVLLCGADEGPLQLGSVAARMAQLFLLDVLFYEFCRRDGAAARANREKIASALADKHL